MKWLQVIAIVVLVIIFVVTIIVDKYRDESKRKSETEKEKMKEIVYNPLYHDLKDVEEKAKRFERSVEMLRYVSLLKYEKFRLAQMPIQLQSGLIQLQTLLYHYNESFDGSVDLKGMQKQTIDQVQKIRSLLEEQLGLC